MEIDLVIPWVDGNDPKWLAEKRACLKEEEGDGRANRFREWIIWNICFVELKKIFHGFARFILLPGDMYQNG